MRKFLRSFFIYNKHRSWATRFRTLILLPLVMWFVGKTPHRAFVPRWGWARALVNWTFKGPLVDVNPSAEEYQYNLPPSNPLAVEGETYEIREAARMADCEKILAKGPVSSYTTLYEGGPLPGAREGDKVSGEEKPWYEYKLPPSRHVSTHESYVAPKTQEEGLARNAALLSQLASVPDGSVLSPEDPSYAKNAAVRATPAAPEASKVKPDLRGLEVAADDEVGESMEGEIG